MKDYNTLLIQMREAFYNLMSFEYRNKKIWWSEYDVIASYYHLLRPTIDLLPNHELYREWYVKFTKGKDNPRLDLALVKTEESPIKDAKGHDTLIEGYVIVAMEFKFGGYSVSDFEKLTKFIEHGADYEKPYWIEGGKVKRLNKGNTPLHAFYFIIDESITDNEKQASKKEYESLQEKYPLVEIVYDWI